MIANINKPTLILSHNKTLAAQLYSEFKGFFPYNAVEYYVSYYDSYQPEAYLPSSDTYIEKGLAINDEIDKLRLAATSAPVSYTHLDASESNKTIVRLRGEERYTPGDPCLLYTSLCSKSMMQYSSMPFLICDFTLSTFIIHFF